jgi:hypothetical protein
MSCKKSFPSRPSALVGKMQTQKRWRKNLPPNVNSMNCYPFRGSSSPVMTTGSMFVVLKSACELPAWIRHILEPLYIMNCVVLPSRLSDTVGAPPNVLTCTENLLSGLLPSLVFRMLICRLPNLISRVAGASNLTHSILFFPQYLTADLSTLSVLLALDRL